MKTRAHNIYKNNRILLAGCISLAAVLHIVAAWHNIGNFHPDGHFQLLEFANYKLGNVGSAGLPWEFFWQIRPAIQPAIAYAIDSLIQFAGVDDPFAVTLILRFISAGIGLSAALLLGFYSLRWINSETLSRWLIPACCLFWALPFVHSSFGSENWSGSLLCLGSLLVLSSRGESATERSTWKAFLGGMLLGFSFYFRFPVAFAIAGLGLWLVVVVHTPRRYLMALAAGLIIAVLVNLCLDYWLYEEWVLTPLRYFESNIIRGRAAEFGVDPWWYYLPRLFAVLLPPWSLLLLPALIFAIIYRPRNPLVWMLLPFLFFHSVIGHKETRFLIPIINLLPILVLIGLDNIPGRARDIASRFSRSAAGIAVITVFVAMNFVLTLIVSFMPAHQSAVIQGWIAEHGREERFTLYTHSQSPYEQAGLVMNYYVSPQVDLITLSTHDELCEQAMLDGNPVLMFIPQFDLPDALQGPCLEWHLETTSLAKLAWFRLPKDWLADSGLWTVYRGALVD